MNNLTPEPRPDINGKVTTRWVRSTPANVNKALLAVPPVPPSAVVQPVTKESIPLLSEVLERMAIPSGRYFDVTAMNQLAVRRVEDQLSSAERVSPLQLDITRADLMGVLKSAHEGGSNWGRAENSTLIHNFAVLGYSNGENPEFLAEGLRMHGEFSNVYDFMLDIPVEAQKRAAALYKVTASVDDHHLDRKLDDAEDGYGSDDDDWNDFDDDYAGIDHRYIKLRDDELANYVMDNHEQVEEIVRIIGERGADLGMIKEMLENNDAPALGKGIL